VALPAFDVVTLGCSSTRGSPVCECQWGRRDPFSSQQQPAEYSGATEAPEYSAAVHPMLAFRMWHSVAYEPVLHVAQHCGIRGGLLQTPAKHVCPSGFVLGLCTKGELRRREDSSVCTRPRLQSHTPTGWQLVSGHAMSPVVPSASSHLTGGAVTAVATAGSCFLAHSYLCCAPSTTLWAHVAPEGTRCLRHTVSGTASTPVVWQIVATDSNATCCATCSTVIAPLWQPT
jgi:hypothetical protein